MSSAPYAGKAIFSAADWELEGASIRASITGVLSFRSDVLS